MSKLSKTFFRDYWNIIIRYEYIKNKRDILESAFIYEFFGFYACILLSTICFLSDKFFYPSLNIDSYTFIRYFILSFGSLQIILLIFSLVHLYDLSKPFVKYHEQDKDLMFEKCYSQIFTGEDQSLDRDYYIKRYILSDPHCPFKLVFLESSYDFTQTYRGHLLIPMEETLDTFKSFSCYKDFQPDQFFKIIDTLEKATHGCDYMNNELFMFYAERLIGYLINNFPINNKKLLYVVEKFPDMEDIVMAHPRWNNSASIILEEFKDSEES